MLLSWVKQHIFIVTGGSTTKGYYSLFITFRKWPSSFLAHPSEKNTKVVSKLNRKTSWIQVFFASKVSTGTTIYLSNLSSITSDQINSWARHNIFWKLNCFKSKKTNTPPISHKPVSLFMGDIFNLCSHFKLSSQLPFPAYRCLFWLLICSLQSKCLLKCLTAFMLLLPTS